MTDTHHRKSRAGTSRCPYGKILSFPTTFVVSAIGAAACPARFTVYTIPRRGCGRGQAPPLQSLPTLLHTDSLFEQCEHFFERECFSRKVHTLLAQ